MIYVINEAHDLTCSWEGRGFPGWFLQNVQLAKSSLAIHGGAIFSAVCG